MVLHVLSIRNVTQGSVLEFPYFWPSFYQILLLDVP